jgi:hypothetical protein
LADIKAHPHPVGRIGATFGGVSSVSEASELKNDVAELEDEALQKRFAALFDDGQGENARRAFVSYCKSRGYHPSEMYILCGNNMFRRLRDMLKRQDKLLDEYRAANKYLFDAASRLNGAEMILPPVETMQRTADVQRLIREKFGNSAAATKIARRALNLSGRQFSRLLTGTDVTDGLIERLEELPDHVPGAPLTESKRRSGQIANRRYKEMEKRFSHIPKPKKFGRLRSTMSIDELRRIGEMLFGEKWISPFAEFIGYSEWQIQSLVSGGDPTRFISEETAKYIRQVDHAFRSSGDFTGASLSRSC